MLAEVRKRPGVGCHIAGHFDCALKQLQTQSHYQNLEEEEAFSRDERSVQARQELQDCRPSVRTAQLADLTMEQEL